MDFARLCVSLLVLFVGFFFLVVFLGRKRSARVNTYIHIVFTLYYIDISMSLYSYTLFYSITCTYSPFSFVLFLSLSFHTSFFLSRSLYRARVYIYIHVRYIYLPLTLITLDYIRFTSTSISQPSCVRKALFFLALHILSYLFCFSFCRIDAPSNTSLDFYSN